MWNPDREMDFSKVEIGYASQEELLNDWFCTLDYRLYLIYHYHVWLGPENRLQSLVGLVVSRDEFEQKLSDATRINGFEAANKDELQELSMRERLMGGRMGQTTGGKIPCLRLISCCGLDAFAWRCAMLAFSTRLDTKYATLFAYLQDDITKKMPTFDLACQLFTAPGTSIAANRSRFVQNSSFAALFDSQSWERGEMSLLPVVEAFLLGQDPPLPNGFRFTSPYGDDMPAVRQALADELYHSARKGAIIILRGAHGEGKRFLAQTTAHRIGLSCLLVDMEHFPDESAERTRTAILLARLFSAVPCLFHMESLSTWQQLQAEDSIAIMPQDYPVLFICTEDDYHADSLADRFVLSLHTISPLEDSQRCKLFEQLLSPKVIGNDVSLSEISTKFFFTPLQIVKATRQAQGIAALQNRQLIGAAELHSCCYAQAIHQLDKLAAAVTPAYTWDELILPPQQIQLMKQACAHIQYGYKVYNEWGFKHRLQYGRGLSMLFSGPPGTGKTMAAQVIANQLHMQIYKIQLSQVVSKYIGETEKNLQSVFHEARKSGCILFFDECDALFGKRSEVKDAHDRHANVETAYLLQQMEEYDGVTIMATNLLQNIDAAFMRRIGFVISFPFPDKGMREKLFRGMLPPEAPVETDIDFEFLAGRFELSGGSIKNIVVAAAFLAAMQDCKIGMSQLVPAAVSELQKNLIVVVREDLREYQDLVDW